MKPKPDNSGQPEKVEPLPCPFCGYPPVFSGPHERDDRRYYVVIPSCGCHDMEIDCGNGKDHTLEQGIKNWNESIQAQQPKTPWISVLDSMPPVDTPVIVWTTRFRKPCPMIAALADRIGESWLSAYWCEDVQRNAFAHSHNEDGSPSAAEVSHWMPLLDGPPKEEH